VPDAQATTTLLTSPIAVGLGVLLLLSFIALLRNSWNNHRRKRRVRLAAARGRAAELEAPAALERRGFRVLKRHPKGRLEWRLDGEPQTAELKADLLVSRGGRRYVVEVKTGRAVRPTKRETRRQLLEYALAYDVDGVLLLDADADQLRQVEFPQRTPTRSWPIAWLVLGTVIGLAAGILLH
jgi:hypothetical protein